MSFANGVLRLVRSGARIELRGRSIAVDAEHPCPGDRPEAVASAVTAAVAGPTAASAGLSDDYVEVAEVSDQAAAGLSPMEPGLAELEAAVELVSMGLAKRVLLCGFQSWPGLLWRAYELVEGTDLLILPTVVRPGGKVDIVVTTDPSIDG